MPTDKKAKMEKATGASLGEVANKLGIDVEERKQAKAEKQKEAKIAAAEKYEAIKKKVLAREARNYSEIILVREKEKPGSNKKRWWKVFGHSAVMLKYEVGKVHHLSFRIQEDDDYGERSKEGVIQIPDLDGFLDKMKRRGYADVKKATEVIVVRLGYSLKVEEYQSLLTIEEDLLRHAGKLIRAKEVLPTFGAVLKELDKQVHEMVRKMDRQSQDAYANKMEEITVGLKIKFIRVARGSYGLEELLKEITDSTENLWGYLAVIMDRQAYELEKVALVGEAIRAVELQVSKEKKALAIKKVDEEEGR